MITPSQPMALPAFERLAVLVGHRRITAGDENALTQRERASVANCTLEVARRSGAARIVARDLLARLGAPSADLVRTRRQPALWPRGIVGSLSHDGSVAVAAVAQADTIAALGIDIEPAEPLPADLVEVIATPAERRRYGGSRLAGRDLHVAKEAAYKATFMLDGIFLDFQDVEVDLDRGRAITATGHTVSLAVSCSYHIVALAVIEREAADARRRVLSSESRS